MNYTSTTEMKGLNVINVLIIDDTEANRALLARRLEKDGHSVSCSESGEAGIKLANQIIPDIILLDYMMPKMNGIEVLAELRASERTKAIPVIMVTARAEGEAVEAALNAGADDYVTKPIDFSVLRARMETQLSKRQDADNLQRANAVLDERVSIRAMALADIEEELRQEIQRREELEAQLEKVSQGSSPEEADLGALAAALEKIETKFESLFNSVVSGKSLNVAQMAELKELIAAARKET